VDDEPVELHQHDADRNPGHVLRHSAGGHSAGQDHRLLGHFVKRLSVSYSGSTAPTPGMGITGPGYGYGSGNTAYAYVEAVTGSSGSYTITASANPGTNYGTGTFTFTDYPALTRDQGGFCPVSSVATPWDGQTTNFYPPIPYAPVSVLFDAAGIIAGSGASKVWLYLGYNRKSASATVPQTATEFQGRSIPTITSIIGTGTVVAGTAAGGNAITSWTPQSAQTANGNASTTGGTVGGATYGGQITAWAATNAPPPGSVVTDTGGKIPASTHVHAVSGSTTNWTLWLDDAPTATASGDSITVTPRRSRSE